jgi:Kef-type K+ transport system membrane component KefB
MTLATGPVPGLTHHQILIFLLQTGLLLATAIVLGRLAVRVNLPPVVGELTAGVVLGPSLLGNWLPGLSNWLLPRNPEQMHLLSAVSQFGVLLLVAITGAHIDLGLLKRKRRVIASVSAGTVLLPLLLGCGLGFVLPTQLMGDPGNRLTFALFIGVAVAVSALPVIAKTLLDMGLLHRNVGQIIIGSAAVSDIIGWMLLSIVSAMATRGLHSGVVLESVGYLLIVLAFAAFLAGPLIARLMGWAERAGGPAGTQVSLSVAIVLIILSAAGTQALGMEPILGAFLCGIVIGSLGKAGRRTLGTMRPFVMAVLAPIFLATAGLQVDLSALKSPKILLAGLATLAVAIGAKFVGGYLGARVGRLSGNEALAIGAGLNARGVVEIVLASVGLRIGVLTSGSYTIVVLVAVVTSVMAPPILRRTAARMPLTSTEIEREREFATQSA